jgi:hypothetical protein
MFLMPIYLVIIDLIYDDKINNIQIEGRIILYVFMPIYLTSYDNWSNI